MEIREALDQIIFEDFLIESSTLNTTARASGLVRTEGITKFQPRWADGKMIVSLRLKSFNDGLEVFDISFKATFADVAFQAFTPENDTELHPILYTVLAGLTFSTARGIIFQTFISLTGTKFILPIVRPELLIQDQGFEISENISAGSISA